MASVDRPADKAARFVAGAESDGGSAFDLWVERYLKAIDDLDGDPRLYLQMGYRPESIHEDRSIVQSDLSKLRATFGGKNADASRLARNGQAIVTLTDGPSAHLEFAPGVT